MIPEKVTPLCGVEKKRFALNACRGTEGEGNVFVDVSGGESGEDGEVGPPPNPGQT